MIIDFSIRVGYWIIPVILTIIGIMIILIGENKNKGLFLGGILESIFGVFLILISWLIYFMAHFFIGFEC